MAAAGIAGVASAVAVLAGTAHAGGTYNVEIIDSSAHYAHAVDIGVDGIERGCRVIDPATSPRDSQGHPYVAFGPSPSGSDVWLHEFPGNTCSYPSAYVPAMRTVHLTHVMPGSHYDLHNYPLNGWG